MGLETVGVEPDARGVMVDAHLRAAERLFAIGDVTGIWPLTHVGEYEGDVVAANIAGDPRPANYEAVPRVTYTDPQAAAVGAIVELAAAHRIEHGHGIVSEPYRIGRAGTLLRAAKACTVSGSGLTVLAGRSRRRS